MIIIIIMLELFLRAIVAKSSSEININLHKNELNI